MSRRSAAMDMNNENYSPTAICNHERAAEYEDSRADRSWRAALETTRYFGESRRQELPEDPEADLRAKWGAFMLGITPTQTMFEAALIGFAAELDRLRTVQRWPSQLRTMADPDKAEAECGL